MRWCHLNSRKYRIALPKMTLPPFALILLPFLSSMVAGCFQHNDLPHAKIVNAVIAAIFFIATSALCWYLGGSISKDPQTNMLYYSAVLGLIFNTSACKALNEAVVEAVPSPLLLLKKREKKH